MRIISLLLAALAGLASQAPKQVTHIKAADIAAGVEKATPRADSSRVLTFLDRPGQRANFVRRTSAMNNNALIHGKGTEVQYILEGSATLVTGGTLVNPLVSGQTPSDSVSTSIRGGERRQVAKGDVIVTPPGTPHQYTEIQGTITYLEVRFDASGN